MPYYFQSRIATRYFVFRNVRHNGQTLEVDKIYSILAPYKSGIRAKNVAPYNSTTLLVSGGIPQLSEAAGNWSIVSKTNKYPSMSILYQALSAHSLSAYNVVSLSSGLSEPFDLVVKDNYFRYRYFVTHPLSGARAAQPTISGRWIYSKKTAFEAYTGFSSQPVNYSFNSAVSSNKMLSGIAVDLSTYGYNFVASDDSKNVIFKTLDTTAESAYTFVSGSSAQQVFQVSFFTKTPTNYNILLPFTDTLSAQVVDSSSFFGYQVANTSRNIAVSDPLSGSGKIYLYSINKTLTGSWISNDRVLYPISATSGFGTKINYKESRNKNGKAVKEILTVSTKTQGNSAIEIFTNAVVTTLSSQPLSSYGTYNFQNRWSSVLLTAANISLTGYYGYDIAFQERDRFSNKVGEFLYVSEPFTGQGLVHMYFVEGKDWRFVTSLSSASATNYGSSIDTGGPYLAVSAPNSIVNSVTGALVDIYKTSTLATTATVVGYQQIIPNIQYKIEKTDTLFIPSSGNFGKNVKLDVNYCVSAPQDRQTTDFYGDHMVITGDDKTQVYCRYFDKFLLNTELSGATKSTIWQNSVFQISNSAVKINSIQ